MSGTDLAGMVSLYGFAQSAAAAAVNGLWQSAAVAAGLAICMRLAPRVSASHRFAAWAAGFGLAAGLPALPFLARLFSHAAGSAAAENGAAHAWLELDARWSLAIAGVWLAASVYRVTGLAVHTARLRGLWKSARPVGFESGALTYTDVRGVEICATGELDRPGVIGFFMPRILIPERLLERLTRDELEQVVLHEAEHLRRRDDWTNLLQKLCLAVFPLNPALVWMDRRLAKEREMACDEGVVRQTGAPRAYAACLASLAERGLESRVARAEALSLGAFERRHELVERVHSLLRSGRRVSAAAGWGLVSTVGCALILGAVELAQCPQMVAFVAPEAAQPAVVAEAPYATREAYAMTRGDEGFRAVNTEAAMPARRMAMGGEMKHAAASPEKAMSRAPHAVPVKARSGETRPAEQEMLVVTWQTTVRAQDFKAQTVADYEDGPHATGTAAAAGAENRPASEMAVTRMFVSVYRANPVAQAASQGKTSVTADKPAASRTRPAPIPTDLKILQNRQTVVPFGDGWLVIQL